MLLSTGFAEIAAQRILISVALGALVGLEREYTQKSAGLRTHIMVTMGSTIFTLVSLADFYSALSLAQVTSSAMVHIQQDPTRIAAQIVTGIGFIGGGGRFYVTAPPSKD